MFRTFVAIAAATATISQCSSPLPSSSSGGGDEPPSGWQATYDDLEQRSGQEDGWVVVRTWVMHEGGGDRTLWMEPCDPETDDMRAMTETVYSGSDVQTMPGHYYVEETVVPCSVPSDTFGDGKFVADTDMVAVADNKWVIMDFDTQLEPIQVSSGQGFTFELPVNAFDVRPDVSCDDVSWAMNRVESTVTLTEVECAGTFAALPVSVRELVVTSSSDSPTNTTTGRLRESEVGSLDAAFVDAGWTQDFIPTRHLDGSQTAEPAWLSACVGDVQTQASWFADEVSTRTVSCG